MPPKVKCFTKPRIPVADGGKGGNYTACLPAKDLDKPEKKKKIKFVIKKPVEEPKKKKIKFYVNNPLKATKKSQPPAQQAKIIAPKKKEPMKAKIIAAVKKTPGEKLTGLTTAEMNKMSPEQLFGMLPVALAKKVLDPKTTGVKVAKEKFTIKDILDLVRRFQVATKSSAYSKISQRQIDIFEKYSNLERLGMSDVEFDAKTRKMNEELGSPFSFGPGDVRYSTNKEMKNFKTDFESMFGYKGLGRYDLRNGSADALLIDVRLIQRILNNPTTPRHQKLKETFWFE